MLDGILGRGFSAKCKSLIKLTRSRIDVIRRKRSATQKFLKKDIADLLSNGLDVNAYGRAEGLLIELRLSSCYDFVDQCCEFLLKQLSTMQKQSDCPEECREAVSSLMFAAARFSDLPELRDLRQTFQERYGDSLEYFLNKEFAEKLSAKPCTMEKKVELMQHIAVEFSIKWNAGNFEQRMSKASVTEQAQPKNGGVLYTFDDKRNVSNGKETSLRGEKIVPPLQHPASNGYKYNKNTDANGWKRNELEIHGEQQQLLSNNVRRAQSGKEVSMTRNEIDFASDRRVRESPSLKPVRPSSSSHRNFDEYGDDGIKPDKMKEKHVAVVDNGQSASVSRDEARFLAMKPPKSEVQATPFDKLKEKHPSGSISRDDARFLAMKPPRSEVQATPFDSSYAKVKTEEDSKRKPSSYAIPPPYVKPNVRKEATVRDGAGPTLDKVSENSEKIENLPRPRSHRRRHSRPRHSHDDDDDYDEEDEKKRRSRRREDPRKGLQILFDDDRRQKDEEERIIDKLLIHYSKKPSFDEEEARSSRKEKSRSRRANERRGGRPKEEEVEVVSPPPPRSISLPREQPSAPPEPVKVYARAASFQPDRSDEARHVHPKLPDYDDLAARFAALKGR